MGNYNYERLLLLHASKCTGDLERIRKLPKTKEKGWWGKNKQTNKQQKARLSVPVSVACSIRV